MVSSATAAFWGFLLDFRPDSALVATIRRRDELANWLDQALALTAERAAA